MRESIELSSYNLEKHPTNIKKELCWNIFVNDFNQKRIVVENIFNYNWIVTNDIISIYKDYKKNGMDFDTFSEKVKRAIMHEYWSRSEYETVVTSWPPHILNDELDRIIKVRDESIRDYGHFYCESVRLDVGVKIDVYTQIMLNWEHFINYLWDNKELIKKLKKVK